VPYQRAWAYQNQLAEQVAAGRGSDILLLLEHPHTYTLGRRAHEKNLLWDQGTLAKQGIEVHEVDRGGDITYHGPGQIVGYPILRLAPIGWQADRLPQADYVGYIRKLEAVLIRALHKFRIMGMRVEGKTGVWVSPSPGGVPQKIASIGVKVDSKGVSRHGFALNVNPDMMFWEGIVPCGLTDVTMTSMTRVLGSPVNAYAVVDEIIRMFGEVFMMSMETVTAPYLSG
jgi:lipoate-protein ligase B